MDGVLAGGVFDGWKTGTAAQLCLVCRGTPPPRLVSFYFIVREQKGRETLEREREESEKNESKEERHTPEQLLLCYLML